MPKGVGQDLSDVVAAGAEGGKEGVTDGVIQGAPRPASVGLHMADFCPDGAAASEACGELWRQAELPTMSPFQQVNSTPRAGIPMGVVHPEGSPDGVRRYRPCPAPGVQLPGT